MPVFLSAVTIAAVLAVSGQSPALALPAENWESRVVAAASDSDGGVPTPLLVGGIVLAFTVGLVAGEGARRRGRARRVDEAVGELPVAAPAKAATPPPAPAPRPPQPKPALPPQRILVAPSPPVRPAPPPPPEKRPEPEPPSPVRTAEPPAKGPEPEPRRETRFGVPAKRRRASPPEPPAPKPPEPPAAKPPEPPAPKPPEPPAAKPAAPPAERPAAPVARLARAPEAVPPAAQAGVQAPAEAPAPLDHGPERVGQAPEPRPAPRRPWPEEAKTVWTCEIEWKPGYRKSFFRAMATPPGGRRGRRLGESAAMRWGLMSDPEPPTRELVEAVRSLLTALEAAGWQRIEPAGPWYSQRFLWRGEGEPGEIAPAPRDDAVGA